MDSKNTYIDEYVGLWCDVKLVTGEVLDGLIYSYNEEQSLLVLVKDLSKKASGRVINTKYIESFKVKEMEDPEGGLPVQLDSYSVLPSMLGGKSKSLMKNANTSISNAMQTRKTSLAPLMAGDGAAIGACDVWVPLMRIYPGIRWDPEKQAIMCSPMVYVEGDPTWATPVVKIKPSDNKDREDSMLADRVSDALKNISK